MANDTEVTEKSEPASTGADEHTAAMRADSDMASPQNQTIYQEASAAPTNTADAHLPSTTIDGAAQRSEASAGIDKAGSGSQAATASPEKSETHAGYQQALDHGLSQESTASLYRSQLELEFGKSGPSKPHDRPATEKAEPSEPVASKSSVQNADTPVTLERRQSAHGSEELSEQEQVRLQQGQMWRGSEEFAGSMRSLFESAQWQSQPGDTPEGRAARLQMLQNGSNKFLDSRGLPPVSFTNFSGEPLGIGAGASYSEGQVAINNHLLAKGGPDLADATAHELTHHEQRVLAVQAAQGKQEPTFADHELLSSTSKQFQSQALASRKGESLSAEEAKRGSQISDDSFIRSGEIQAYWDAKATIPAIDSLSSHLLEHNPNEFLTSANSLQDARVNAVEARIGFEDHQYRPRLEEKEAFEVGARVKRAYLQ